FRRRCDLRPHVAALHLQDCWYGGTLIKLFRSERLCVRCVDSSGAIAGSSARICDGGGRWTGCFSFCLIDLSSGGRSGSLPRAGKHLHAATVRERLSPFDLQHGLPNSEFCSIPSSNSAKL